MLTEPPTTETQAQFETLLGPLQAALVAPGPRGPFAEVVGGPPPPGETDWMELDGSTIAAGAAPGVHQFPVKDPVGKVAGYWVLQNLAATVPLVVSYLYATQRRVPALQGNALLRNVRWLNHVRLVQPRCWVLPGDPLAGAEGVTVVADEPALTAEMLAEVERTYGPIIQAFRTHRRVATAHGWASVVDGLHKGFMLAGRSGLGLDAAWELWNTTTNGWQVPTRRWPRRLQFVRNGRPDELAVRAACSLAFTAINAAGQYYPYCTNCPLDIGDEDRVRRLLIWLEQQEAAQSADNCRAES